MQNETVRKTNSFVQIFDDNWSDFKNRYPSYKTKNYQDVVTKMIGCGDVKFGYIEYGCMNCGEHRHRVAFTCKSQLCLRCGRVKSEKFVNNVMGKLHDGIVYRHLILTIPGQLKKFFYENRHSKDLYSLFYEIGFKYIQDVLETVSKKRLHCGALVVLHTTGRKGNYRPHLHIIVMNGGIDKISGKWINIGYFPYENILPKKWQWHLLEMVKNFDPSFNAKKLVGELWKKYPKGFYNSFLKGDVPRRSQHLVKYLSKYLFRPQISVKRIKRYDKKRKEVTYEYADHKSKKSEVEKVSVIDFIGRMVQQVLPKGFHKVKYYGLQRPKSFAKSKALIKDGLKKVNALVFDSDQSVFRAAKDSYQERMKLWTGKDPLECPSCSSQMEVIKIWSKGKGVIFDLLEVLKRSHAPPIKLIKLENAQVSEPINIIENFFEQLDLAI